MSDPTPADASPRRIALLGNPNVGKTTLINRLSGSRHRTANFPGTTQEALVGRMDLGETGAVLIDLPGVYALDLNLSESSLCRAVLAGQLAPEGEGPRVPDVLVVVLDATNLLRNLTLVAEAVRLRLRTCVVINMIDEARRRGIHADEARLGEVLGCPAVAVSARTGEGMDRLAGCIASARVPDRSPPTIETGGRDAIEAWAEETYAFIASARETRARDTLTDRLDRAFTHPVLGVLTFVAVMTGLFYVIFALAAYPMGWIDALFGWLGGGLAAALPGGLLRDLLTDGVVAGIGGTVIFLPQICLLFLLISLLEGTGYLARAAFVIDRVMRPFGLSGHSFVPLLSAHACALPGIMACRAIPDRRDRLATILVAPFMSCTARIPVYAMLTGILFPGSPARQALAFTGCYVLGACGGMVSALIARRTILRGRSRPMALELPSYRVPDVRHALRATADRGWLFLRKAGTLILAISVVLWWLGAFPRQEAPNLLQTQIGPEMTRQEVAEAERFNAEQLELYKKELRAYGSYLDRIGGFVQPVFGPIGYDKRLTVGVLASFAAREVFVSTMAVQIVGRDDLDDTTLLQMLEHAPRVGGGYLFDRPTSWSLLVFYVFASLCLPTTVVTAKESGSWRWALLQLGWMSCVAYLGALAVYHVALALG